MLRFILLCVLIMIAGLIASRAQEMVIKGYEYRMVSTDLSPRQAIGQARREALVACVQENLGTTVMNLTRLEKQESNRTFMEKFNEYTQQVSFGFVRQYKIRDTITRYDPATLSLETKITLDITLYRPESENDLGLIAATNRTTYFSNDAAVITYSLKKKAWIYIFDLSFRNEYCLISESEDVVMPGDDRTFPEPAMVFELNMSKEDQGDFEFGSFVMVASEKPLNFGVKPAISNGWKFDCLGFDQFFRIIASLKKDHSITYLPYCIEEKNK